MLSSTDTKHSLTPLAVLSTNDSEDKATQAIEHRLADATCEPYLALSAILALAGKGIREKNQLQIVDLALDNAEVTCSFALPGLV